MHSGFDIDLDWICGSGMDSGIGVDLEWLLD